VQREAAAFRLQCMRRLPLLGLLVVAGCGSPAAVGGGGECTAIGARVGVSVDVAARSTGPAAGGATLEACWADVCRTYPVELSPSTTAAGTTCQDTARPDAVCSAEVRETGGKQGFADIPDLPARPVRLTLTVTDDAGARLAGGTLEVTPETVYPNGPDCDPGGPQAGLAVDGAGTVRDSTR
jgi:hypothetical protein